MLKTVSQVYADSRITSKYQLVIPAPIRKVLGVEAGDELIWRIELPKANKAEVWPNPQNWSKYLSGLGKRVWEGEDTDKYLKALKEEWRR